VRYGEGYGKGVHHGEQFAVPFQNKPRNLTKPSASSPPDFCKIDVILFSGSTNPAEEEKALINSTAILWHLKSQGRAAAQVKGPREFKMLGKCRWN
jgi:hypothetical protein